VTDRLLLDLYAALLGLVTGSYLNVVIHRLPRRVSTVLPRSRCPACGAPIRPLDNVPIVSWLALRGRCRDCGSPISARYPLVEAAAAVLFVLSAERFGLTLAALAAALLCALLLALAAIDVEHLLLPDRLTLPGIAAGVALQPVTGWAGAGWRGLAGGLLGAALGAGVLLAAYGLWWLVRREEGLGLGDVKMLAMIGAFLGWKGVVVSLFVGAAAGAVFGLSAMALGRAGLRSKVPFGAFLAAGALVALFAGPELVRLYLDAALGAGPAALGPPSAGRWPAPPMP
jgi:leader peptidase (prepilin peptidase)/N-methyltransferase